MKDVDRRLQPIAIAPHGNFADSWFKDKTRYGLANGSFPSGHTISAFSVATVVARRYGKHRWVPYVAYGLAAAVGFSKLHFRLISSRMSSWGARWAIPSVASLSCVSSLTNSSHTCYAFETG